MLVYHFRRSQNSDLDRHLAPLQNMRLATCQRALVFVSEDQEDLFLNQLPKNLNSERLEGASMYQFLLEVICGLKSDLLGETEIQGQFKNFIKLELQNKDSDIHRWNSTFQCLLSDAKEVRQNHLKDLGSSSYGSLTRKILKEMQQISVVGAGQLASEMEPWFGLKEVFFYSRKNQLPILSSKSKGPRASFPLSSLQERKKIESLVVAANLSNRELAETLKPISEIKIMLDWRGESALSMDEVKKLNIHNYYSFHQLMNQLSEEKEMLHQKLIPAFELILKKSEAFSTKSFARPLGWDDLCA